MCFVNPFFVFANNFFELFPTIQYHCRHRGWNIQDIMNHVFKPCPIGLILRQLPRTIIIDNPHFLTVIEGN